jgi:hypothetical protein
MNLSMRSAVAALACLAASGCYDPGSTYAGGGSSSSYTSQEPYSPWIIEDAYSPAIKVATNAGERGGGYNVEKYALFGLIDRKSGAARTYVQWAEIYVDKGWRFYYRASNDKGEPYEFSQVARDVGNCSPYSGCVHTETYNIYIPARDMKAGAKDGISFKIFGKDGSERIINLNADLVAAFDEKMIDAAKMRAKK